MRYEPPEMPLRLTLKYQLLCVQALSMRPRCDHAGECMCVAIDALLRKGAEGQPLFLEQRDELSKLLAPLLQKQGTK